MIGVVGGSGSGKTTVARSIYDLPGMDAAFIDQDAYYRDLSRLPLEERKRVNFDHPDAFDAELLARHIEALSRGRLQRDTQERGRSMDDVIRRYLATVRPMHLEFVEPSKRYADVIIPKADSIGSESR